MIKKLLVIISDRLSTLIQKGEVVPRYYNPGNYFDEVHIMMSNDDQPDAVSVQTMVGSARLYLYNHPEPFKFFKKTLGWQTFLMKAWVQEAIAKVNMIQPSLIRCYGMHLHSYLACQIKKSLKIPLLLSLHTNLDESLIIDGTVKSKILHFFLRRLEKKVYKECDLVLPVYKSIITYLIKRKIENYQVCYNFLNNEFLEKKENYVLSSSAKAICIGRQTKGKEPFHIISALKEVDNIIVTFIGDGEYHDQLIAHAKKEGVLHKTDFIKRMENSKLCKILKQYDFMVINTEYDELPKVILEAFLTGLPVLLNHRKKSSVPELTESICLRVDNSPQGYKEGLIRMIEDHSFRKNLAQNAYNIAHTQWNPNKCEEEYLSLYKKFVPE